MPRIAYVNGRFVPFAEAEVHIEDRGYQFADAVYEVLSVTAGRFLDEDAHWARLGRSLGELGIGWPVREAALRQIVRETVRRNRVTHGLVYLQVSRGVAPRDHAPPVPPPVPSLVITVRRSDPARAVRVLTKGLSVIGQPDLRWQRCDIKTVGLLPNVMAIAAAKAAGADDAWLMDSNGFVTEATRSNCWIVDKEGTLVTRGLDTHILHGVTRAMLFDIAADLGRRVVERAFTLEEAKGAREAFMSASSLQVSPVVRIDGTPVGPGTPGEVAKSLREHYLKVRTPS